jgi:thymidylate synthase (FAD)
VRSATKAQARRLLRFLARIGLPLSAYTEWYRKIDLHNLLRFIRLRASPHAQFEIRAYAIEISKIVQKWMPNVLAAFEDFEIKSFSFGPPSISVIQKWIQGERPTQAERGLSKSECEKLCRLFLTI